MNVVSSIAALNVLMEALLGVGRDIERQDRLD